MQSLSEEPLVSCSCTCFLSTGPATADDFQPGIQGIKGHESTCDVMFCQVRQSLVSWLLTVRTAHHCNIYHHCPSLKNMNFLTLWNIQLDSWTNFQCLKYLSTWYYKPQKGNGVRSTDLCWCVTGSIIPIVHRVSVCSLVESITMQCCDVCCNKASINTVIDLTA